MPMRRRTVTTPDNIYGRPFVGPTNHPSQIAVNIAVLTTAEVDADGYIKPGVPLSAAGALVGAGVAVHGVVPEPIKVATSNVAGDLTAAGVVQLTVMTIGQVNRGIIESNLGRVLTANEIAGFGLAGCLVKLLA